MNLSLYPRTEYAIRSLLVEDADYRLARARKPRTMNFNAYWNYQNKIEEVEINQQDLEVDHRPPHLSRLFSLKSNLNPNHNPRDHYLNHSSTRLRSPNQHHWTSIPLLAFELYIRSQAMKLGS
jgi:hypothetical protein